MITDQPVDANEDMREVPDNFLRDAGMIIEESDGNVTFAGK